MVAHVPLREGQFPSCAAPGEGLPEPAGGVDPAEGADPAGPLSSGEVVADGHGDGDPSQVGQGLVDGLPPVPPPTSAPPLSPPPVGSRPLPELGGAPWSTGGDLTGGTGSPP
ncbi:hypothetical protein ACFCVY_14925 [Streptomyces sp. NPDC056411]|uniref:hypothetical protein n=1 Tax=Streptomyces sp. NPDC056411 TaxID=3345813 RepID=UPI0035D74946